MKIAFAIVTLSSLLSACAVAPQQQVAAPAPVQPVAQESVVEVPITVAETPAVEDKLPNIQLTPDLLYRLLRAEMEFRSGNWQSAYITTLMTAQQTRDPRLARRAAEMALAAKRPQESMAAIRLWRELAPNSEEAGQYFLGFAIMSDNLDEAEEILARKLAEVPAPSRGAVLFQVQQLLSRARDKTAGAELMERLTAPYKDSFEGRIVLSQSAGARGDNQRAVQEAQGALALKPDSELAVLALAQATGNDDAVSELLGKFLAANPNAKEVRAARARVLVNQKLYKEARDEFALLLKAQPDSLSNLYAMGLMSMQLADQRAAEEHFSRFIEVLESKPGDERDASRVLMMLAQIAEDRGDLAAARRWIDKVDSANPSAQLQAQLKRAQLTGKQGDLKGARALLDDIKSDDASEQAQVALTQGQILRDAGKFDDAYKSLEGASRRFPGNPDVLYDFALAAEKIGKVEVMEKTLRAVIAQAPDNHHAYNALGYSLAERNVRLPEALELIDKALKMAPGDPFIMDSMGWVHYRMGKLKDAEEMLRRAYALRSDPEIAVHLAEVLWKAGKHAESQQLLREARAKDPTNDTLRSTLARLNVKL